MIGKLAVTTCVVDAHRKARVATDFIKCRCESLTCRTGSCGCVDVLVVVKLHSDTPVPSGFAFVKFGLVGSKPTGRPSTKLVGFLWSATPSLLIEEVVSVGIGAGGGVTDELPVTCFICFGEIGLL